MTATSSPAPHPAISNITASTTSAPIPSTPDNDYTIAPPLVTSSEELGTEPLHLRLPQYHHLPRELVHPILDLPRYPDLPTKTRQLGLQHLHRPQHYNRLKRLHLPNPPHPPPFLILHLDRAELESEQKNLLHSSIRARLRVILNGLSNTSMPSAYFPLSSTAPGANTIHPVDPGAVLGLFTYVNDANESDIEILTRDPLNRIRYMNQPSDNDIDSTDAYLAPGEAWTE